MAKVYLIVLRGQGDTEIKVVDKETFDWITSSDPGHGLKEMPISWDDMNTPASQLAKMKKQDDTFWSVYLTCGSWENDRALACAAADGYAESYGTIKSAMNTITKKGDVLTNEYHGEIY